MTEWDRLGLRIVLVDDEEVLAHTLARRLARGNTVRVFQDPRVALEFLTGSPDEVDVVLSDVTMPSLDGGELFDLVTARWPRLRDRFVFMTGAGEEMRLALSARTGCEVLGKPTSVVDLRDALLRAFTRG